MTTKLKIVVITAVVLIAGGAIYALSTGFFDDDSTPTTNQAVPAQETDSSNTNVAPSNGGDSTLSPLPKPLLSKSSGNNAPVTAGVLVQFVCEGTLEASCEVKLTDTNDPSREVKLEPKVIKDDGRGGNFVTWDWTAESGTWKVVATISKTGYASSSSDEQTLTVN